MTYDLYDTSPDKGQPVELYYFRYGSDPGAFYAYCDGPEEVVHAGVTYTPLAMDRGSTPISGSLDNQQLDVTVPIDSGIAERFRLYPPSAVVTLTIRQTHYGDPDAETAVVWVGRVLGSARASSNPRAASLACEPSSTGLKRTGLRRHYQLSCPHVLYGPRCSAVKTLRTGTITALEYTTVTLAVGWNGSNGASKYRGGMVEWAGQYNREYRTILKIIQNKLYLNGPTTGLLVGGTVSVVLGCDHTIQDCETVHNNVKNFGGQPWIPLDNPIHKSML